MAIVNVGSGYTKAIDDAKKSPETVKEKAQDEVFGKLNAATAFLETLPSYLSRTSYSYSTSAFGFLMLILKQIGVNEETIKKWLVDIMTVVLPAIEVSAKANLLYNLKGLVDCHLDPRIPEIYRKELYEGYFTPIGFSTQPLSVNRGLIINVNAIDPDNLLAVSPLTDMGRDLYFGQYHTNGNENVVESYVEAITDDNGTSDEIKSSILYNKNGSTLTAIGQRKVNPYEFVRAADCDAFIWLCIHKPKLPSPSFITIENGATTIGGCPYEVTNGAENILEYIELERTDITKPLGVNLGGTFTSTENKQLLSIAIQAYPKTKIVPVSSDWNSFNWYVDRDRYYKENLTSTISTERNYGNEFGVFNLKFMKPYDYAGRAEDYEGVNNLLFHILPAPFVITPMLAKDVAKDKVKIRGGFSKILFNSKGKQDKNGKFTINPTLLDINAVTTYTDTSSLWIPLKDIENRALYYNWAQDIYGVIDTSNENSINYVRYEEYEKYLVECYPGLTLYEFNYDFIMGMRLFDPQVLMRRLLNNISNPAYNSMFTVDWSGLYASSNGNSNRSDNASYANGKYKILNLVKKIIEGDEELNDCFYTFSNEDYKEMLDEAAQARYHEVPYRLWNSGGGSVNMSTVHDILDGYPVEGTLQEKREVISKAIEQAMVVVDEYSTNNQGNSSSSKNYSSRVGNGSAIRIQFATDLLTKMVSTIIDALFTPKLLLLMEVNRQMLMDKGSAPSVDSLLSAMTSIVKSIVSNILNMLMEKMLDYIISFIKELAQELMVSAIKEILDEYMTILMQLLSYFRRGISALEACQSLISSRFGQYGQRYNQALTELANGTENMNFDIPTMKQNIGYFDNYISTLVDTPDLSNC